MKNVSSCYTSNPPIRGIHGQQYPTNNPQAWMPNKHSQNTPSIIISIPALQTVVILPKIPVISLLFYSYKVAAKSRKISQFFLGNM